MTESMIERCARALQLRHFEGNAEEADKVWCETFEDDPYKEAYRSDVRAVLNTLKEPDEGVLAILRHECSVNGYGPRGGPIVWSAMISHILKESDSK